MPCWITISATPCLTRTYLKIRNTSLAESSSFRRRPESSVLQYVWMPAYAGMTE